MSSKCFGPELAKVTHSKACRLGRPLCRWRRKMRWGVCLCGSYAYPHRLGSGNCGRPERTWAELDKPLRAGRG